MRPDHYRGASRLVEDYPALANIDAYGPDVASRLVHDGWLMPVLDGLDEMPPALHQAAIDALDQALAAGDPLLVTCRSNEYQSAVVSSGSFLSRAAVVEIEPVDISDAITFLGQSEKTGDVRWQPVCEHLRAHPDGALAAALSTPLMVHLARTAYTLPGTIPAELCDPSRFGDRSAIEEHLLDAYLPSVYAPHRTHRPAPEHLPTALYPYDPEQAGRWLAYLAAYLHQLDRRDVAWWEVDRALHGWCSGS